VLTGRMGRKVAIRASPDGRPYEARESKAPGAASRSLQSNGNLAAQGGDAATIPPQKILKKQLGRQIRFYEASTYALDEDGR
jgi:hypothetical protein